MLVTAEKLSRLIEVELAAVADVRVVAHVRSLLVDPYAVLLNWDYGKSDQQHSCSVVLRDAHSDAEIVYCEQGFGPLCPWGLHQSGHQSMGMDSSWYATFMDAFFESLASVQLRIWRVFQV